MIFVQRAWPLVRSRMALEQLWLIPMITFEAGASNNDVPKSKGAVAARWRQAWTRVQCWLGPWGLRPQRLRGMPLFLLRLNSAKFDSKVDGRDVAWCGV